MTLTVYFECLSKLNLLIQLFRRTSNKENKKQILLLLLTANARRAGLDDVFHLVSPNFEIQLTGGLLFHSCHRVVDLETVLFFQESRKPIPLSRRPHLDQVNISKNLKKRRKCERKEFTSLGAF